MDEKSPSLTVQQRAAVNHDRDMFLLACPGSGKTRTAAARISRLAREGVLVAACSYTNTGVDALRQALFDDHQLVLTPRHFIGTLHGMLLRTVTYPYGHLLYGATPRLLPDDSPRWPDVNVGAGNKPRLLKTSCFRLRPDATLRLANVPYTVGLPPEEILARGSKQAFEHKRKMASQGWLSFDDAMYIAMRVLRSHPAIAAAVAARFDEILIDEAQDTSELQLACLSTILDTDALRSLVLVGDYEQSINAYTGASPTGCSEIAQSKGLERVVLTENHRSSQKICDIAAYFCARQQPDTAVGLDAHHPLAPEILTYPALTPQLAVADFHTRLLELGEDPNNAAILVRTNTLADELNGELPDTRISPRPLKLGSVVTALRTRGTLTKFHIEQIEEIVALAAFGEQVDPITSPDQRAQLRAAALDLVENAPDLDTDLRTWIQKAAKVLTEVSGRLTDTPAKTGGVILRSSVDHAQFHASKVFGTDVPTIQSHTVHDIKGETRDAVLIVLDRKRKNREAQSALWAARLRKFDTPQDEAEEVRIAFVALSRARRYLAVAIPDDTDEQTIDAFLSAGFRTPPWSPL
ncbi:UvrD-helicase domain-containing protein [Nocardia nova]|nr:ATP-dependent helicase [Nocardia nova]